MLGIVNDAEHGVEVVIDEELWGQSLQCHPLVNTATLVISPEGVERFILEHGLYCKEEADG